MSATRSPKVSERVAPKPADPQPKKKKHDEDDGPDFGTLVHAWIESHLPGHGRGLEPADGLVAVA